MSASSNGVNKQLNTLPETTRYEVGYKKPPSDTRFKKGSSGNPKGRPKGAKNKIPGMHEERLKDIILQEAYRTVPVQDRGKTVSIPLAPAVVRSLAVNAAKGNTRSQRLFTQMLSSTETSRKREYTELLDVAITYKVEWEGEIERCKRLGLPDPAPLPHPDDVVVNMHTGAVSFKCPITKEEKATIDMFKAKRIDLRKEIDMYREDLTQPKNESQKHLIEDEIAHAQKLIDIINKALPERGE